VSVKNFYSDNVSDAAPEILQALVAANAGDTAPHGAVPARSGSQPVLQAVRPPAGPLCFPMRAIALDEEIVEVAGLPSGEPRRGRPPGALHVARQLDAGRG
jgi:hypothetical protein